MIFDDSTLGGKDFSCAVSGFSEVFIVACENIRFSSLFAAGDVSRAFIVDVVNIFQKQTMMSKIRSSGINDSDGSKTFVEYSNLNLSR